jgi:hypothetical protein
MTRIKIFLPCLLVALALLEPDRADAMPMFARKYRLACATCHDAPAIPRLNATGYKFRRAGFRMPEQIGQEESSEFSAGDYFSGRIQTDLTVDSTNVGSESEEEAGTEEEGTEETNATFSGEVTVYPLTGSFQKHWATETEIGLEPGEAPEIENAYGRGVWGDSELWVELRAGIFHPIEGFGGSDRPLGVTAPLFESQGAGSQDTLFRLDEMDRLGAEAGLQWQDTSLTVQIVNSLQTVLRDGEVAATGTLPGVGRRADLAVFANQILGSRSGVSAYWAHGATRPAVDVAAFAAGTSEATWRNAYDRLALFGSFGASWFTVLAGAALGFDQSRDLLTGEKSRFSSHGLFAEGDVALGARTTAFLRLDHFDPSDDTRSGTQNAATVGAVLHDEWIFATPELQYKLTARESGDDRRDAAVVLRVAAIY